MTLQEEVLRLRYETKKLRRRTNGLERSRNSHRSKSEKLEEKNDGLEKENRELKKEVEDLQAKLALASEKIDTYKGMVFKPNVSPAKPETEKRSRGGQKGHAGHNRKLPEVIDEEKRIFLSHCPGCDTELDRSDTTYNRIVEDIPPLKVIVTRYVIERQWCKVCKKEVCAVPKGVVPGFRFGQNIVGSVLFQKYRLRLPLNKIREHFKECYWLVMSQGNIQNILAKAREWFGKSYADILEAIRRSKVKHADETGWRIMGHNGWCWLFATKKQAYYTIEETRGKGVPQKVLGPDPRGVLVRDDYPGYKKLPLEHQSCWTHLLRKNREACAYDHASEEMRSLHAELTALFAELKRSVETPFQKTDRVIMHREFLNRIRIIRERIYLAKDAQAVQTRIRNQDNNLLTALLHEGVPLTNNHAEQQIRAMAVTRKISGGSRSHDGAMTHAVNMSIVQTCALQGKSVLQELMRLIGDRTGGKFVLEVGE